MKDFLKDATFNMSCPNCKSNIVVKVSSVGTFITCPHCYKSIKLEDNRFSSGAKDINKKLDNLLKGFK